MGGFKEIQGGGDASLQSAIRLADNIPCDWQAHGGGYSGQLAAGAYAVSGREYDAAAGFSDQHFAEYDSCLPSGGGAAYIGQAGYSEECIGPDTGRLDYYHEIGGIGGATIGGTQSAICDSIDLAGGEGMVSTSESYQGDLSYYQSRVQQDPNPLVIRKPLTGLGAAYTQNIHVRFLKPPPPPLPGPLIIREVRPPQAPPPPPLVIKQRPPPPRVLPPIILREKPPKPPLSAQAQVVVKRLPQLPPPPRQLVIERYPPLPPKPRDIYIERWIPYGPMPKRKVIYQRSRSAIAHKVAKNVIICYDLPPAHVRREFHRHGVTIMNPISYYQRYGHTLLDSHELIARARSLGVHESLEVGGAYGATLEAAYGVGMRPDAGITAGYGEYFGGFMEEMSGGGAFGGGIIGGEAIGGGAIGGGAIGGGIIGGGAIGSEIVGGGISCLSGGTGFIGGDYVSASSEWISEQGSQGVQYAEAYQREDSVGCGNDP